MFETIKNAFKDKNIRKKMLYTVLMIFIYRIGCFIPVPGIRADAIGSLIGDGEFFQLLGIVSGGALSQGTIFALGIVPFINAFIIMQLLTLIIPRLERMSKEGEEGRKKITQITRYVAIVLAIIQSIGVLMSWKGSIKPAFGDSEASIYSTMVLMGIILVGGSTLVMWIGERITEYGIGNGTSLIIFIGILSGGGTALLNSFGVISNNLNLLWNLFGFILVIVAIFVFIIFVDLAERRITVQYAKQVKGNKMYGGQKTHIPIRVNASGVMPIIFASAFLMFPQMIMGLFWPESGAYAWYSANMGIGTWPYYVFMVLFIVFFAYFYAQIQFNPEDVARNIQQYGGYVQGIRPGKPTCDYLRKINNRITLFGAIFLAIIAVIPTFIFQAIGQQLGLANAFSATGLLILVSVALEFNTQLESQVMMRYYKGFLK